VTSEARTGVGRRLTSGALGILASRVGMTAGATVARLRCAGTRARLRARRCGYRRHERQPDQEGAGTGKCGARRPGQLAREHEESVQRQAGSLTQSMPPLAERASARTAVHGVLLLDGALSVRQAADLLGVTAGRVRQRLTARTLQGVHTRRGGSCRPSSPPAGSYVVWTGCWPQCQMMCARCESVTTLILSPGHSLATRRLAERPNY